MTIRRFSVVLLFVAVSAARGQSDPELSLGPGLGGHRNDGLALMLSGASGLIGLATFLPQQGGVRTLAGLALVTGVATAAGGELMRENDSARRGFANLAIGFGAACTTIGSLKLFNPARPGRVRFELSPLLAPRQAGLSTQIRF
jgi:hypothetical protein